MIRILLVLILLCVSPAAGKEAAIKSGEHADFSRLVLYLNETPEWSLTQEGRSAVISVKGWSKGFDTSKVFDFIPKSRLTAIESTKDTVRLTLACDCDVMVEPLNRIGLVVDLRASTQGPPLPEVAERPSPTVWPEGERFAPTSTSNAASQLLRKTLTEKIGKASTQALLVPTALGAPLATREEPLPTTKLPVSLPVGRLRATSATDRAMAAQIQSVSKKPLPTCPDLETGEIEAWATAEPFAAQLGRLRSRLVGEFDRQPDDQTLDLARFYLHYAMTAEAIAVLASQRIDGPKVDFLRFIAAVLDGEDKRPNDLSLPTNGCKGSIAIWAALHPDADSLTETQSKTVSSAFMTLPRHLKSFLGPRLMSKMKREGWDTAASTIQNALSRGKSPEDTVVGRSYSDDTPARELKEIVALNNENSVGALLVLMDQSWDDRRLLDEAMLDIAVSYAVQFTGTPSAEELRFSLARHEALEGDYRRALDSGAALTDPAAKEELTRIVISEAYRDSSDAEFAKFALALDDRDLIERLTAAQRRTGGRRLAEMGLPDLAGRFHEDRARQPQAATQIAGTTRDADEVATPTAAPRQLDDAEVTLAGARSALESSQSARAKVRALLEQKPAPSR